MTDMSDKPQTPAVEAQIAELRQQIARMQKNDARDEIPGRTIIETPTRLYAHCPALDSMGLPCPGVEQEMVDGIVQSISETIGYRSGQIRADDPSEHFMIQLTEASREYLRFAVEADGACPQCGRLRDLSRTERPVYPVTIGGSDGLLRLRRIGIDAFDPKRQDRIVAGEKETPREQLDRQYVTGALDDVTYARMRAVLEGGDPEPPALAVKPRKAA